MEKLKEGRLSHHGEAIGMLRSTHQGKRADIIANSKRDCP